MDAPRGCEAYFLRFHTACVTTTLRCCANACVREGCRGLATTRCEVWQFCLLCTEKADGVDSARIKENTKEKTRLALKGCLGRGADAWNR